MAAMLEEPQAKQVFRMPNGEFAIETDEPFFLVVKVNGRKFTDRELSEVDRANEDLRIETNSDGDFEIMPPPFPETSRRNNELDFQLTAWAKQDKTGVCFESSAKFTLPSGAKRMPDAAWILKERYYALSAEEREEKFSQIAPDFVIELRLKSDRLKNLKNKMNEYIENGVRLGWLIDPYERKVHVYRATGEIQILENPEKVSGETVLAGFELDTTEIW